LCPTKVAVRLVHRLKVSVWLSSSESRALPVAEIQAHAHFSTGRPVSVSEFSPTIVTGVQQ